MSRIDFTSTNQQRSPSRTNTLSSAARRPGRSGAAAAPAAEESVRARIFSRAAANRTGSTPDLGALAFEALESDAEFDHVLFDAQQFGLNAEVGSADEQEFLGLPGLLELDQVATLLRARQSAQKGS